MTRKILASLVLLSAHVCMYASERVTFLIPSETFTINLKSGCQCGDTCDCGKGGGCDCVYPKLRAESIKNGTPLVVFVKQDGFGIPGIASCSTTEFAKLPKCVAICKPTGNELYIVQTIDGTPTVDQIQAAINPPLRYVQPPMRMQSMGGMFGGGACAGGS